MEASEVFGAGVATPRKAAWWAWPLILLCLVPLEPIFDRVAPLPKEVVQQTGLTDLAMLKMQAKVVIAVSTLDPGTSERARRDLGRRISGDRGLAAVALVESFIEPGSPRAAAYLARAGSPEWMPIVHAALTDGISEEQRESLREHIGWFSGLARSEGGEAPPAAAAIRQQSLFALALMSFAVVGAITGILCGAVLLILHLRRVQENPAVNAFVAQRGAGGPLLEAFALYLGFMVLGSVGAIWLGPAAAITGYALSVIVPLWWPHHRGMDWAEVRQLMGLHRGRGWWREVRAGVVGYFGVLAIASIGIAVSVIISLVAGYFAGGGDPGAIGEGAGGGAGPAPGGGGPVAEPNSHPIVGWFYVDSFWLHLGTFALAAIYAPVVEELFFRGALLRFLRGRFRFLASALLASLIFAALHPQGVYGIPALTAIAIGFSMLREWRDSLIAPMVAHAINNGCIVLLLWSLV